MWRAGQARVLREARDRAELDRATIHAGAWEAILDALVLTKRAKRTRRTGDASGRPKGLTGAALESALDEWAWKFPEAVH